MDPLTLAGYAIVVVSIVAGDLLAVAISRWMQ